MKKISLFISMLALCGAVSVSSVSAANVLTQNFTDENTAGWAGAGLGSFGVVDDNGNKVLQAVRATSGAATYTPTTPDTDVVEYSMKIKGDKRIDVVLQLGANDKNRTNDIYAVCYGGGKFTMGRGSWNGNNIAADTTTGTLDAAKWHNLTVRYSDDGTVQVILESAEEGYTYRAIKTGKVTTTTGQAFEYTNTGTPDLTKVYCLKFVTENSGTITIDDFTVNDNWENVALDTDFNELVGDAAIGETAAFPDPSFDEKENNLWKIPSGEGWYVSADSGKVYGNGNVTLKAGTEIRSDFVTDKGNVKVSYDVTLGASVTAFRHQIKTDPNSDIYMFLRSGGGVQTHGGWEGANLPNADGTWTAGRKYHVEQVLDSVSGLIWTKIDKYNAAGDAIEATIKDYQSCRATRKNGDTTFDALPTATGLIGLRLHVTGGTATIDNVKVANVGYNDLWYREIASLDGGNRVANLKLNNPYDTYKNFVFVQAMYDGNKALEKIIVTPVTNASLTAPTTDTELGKMSKYMVWDALDGLKPIVQYKENNKIGKTEE